MQIVPTTDARVYLIRHGETEWSRSGRHTSRTDVPLTPNGEQQARQLGERLRATTFQRVLTSPMLRARRTCELIGWTGVEVDADLTEWDYGDYEGQLSVDISKTRPGWNMFRDGCPHGESPAQVSARADRLIARLRTFTGNTAICTHGHFGRAIAARWIGQTVEEARPFLLTTASTSVLGYEHNRTDMPALVLWNSV